MQLYKQGMILLMRYFLIIFISFYSNNAFAVDNQFTKKNISCVCDVKVKDPWEEPQSFAFGRFNGQCIDSCRFRASRILKVKKTHKVASLTVANILHYGVFYQGSIPLDSLEGAQAGFEEFLPGIYHVFLQFNLKSSAPAIKLYSQADSTKTIEVRSLVLSPEGVPPKGHKYSLLESYFGYYLLANRLVTGEEMLRWTKDLKHPLKMFDLKIDQGLVGKMFHYGVQESDRLGLQNIYQLFSNNCSTSVLGIVDHGLGAERSPHNWLKYEEALPIVGPVGTLRALMLRNLVDSQVL